MAVIAGDFRVRCSVRKNCCGRKPGLTSHAICIGMGYRRTPCLFLFLVGTRLVKFRL